MKSGNLSSNKIAIINIISTFILQGMAFLTMPIFAKMLGKDQFGEYSTCFSWVTILSCLMGLCVYSSISTGHLEFEKDYYGFRSSIFSFGLVTSLILLFIGFLCRGGISDFIGYPVWIIAIIFVGAFGQFVMDFVNTANIYEKKAEQNLFVSFFLSVATIVLSIYLIKKADAKFLYAARLKGMVFPYIIMAIICGTLILLRGKTLVNKEYYKYGLMLGVPIVFHSLAGNVLSLSDRVMMKKMDIPTGDIGVYSLFYTLSSVLLIVLHALNNAWCPFYYDDLKRNNIETIKKKVRNYIELFTVLAMGFMLLSREVGYFVGGEEFVDGVDLLPLLTFVVFFTFMYQFPVNYEFYNKKTYLITIATVSSGIINIILNIILIPLFGYWGAAVATALSYACLFVIHFTFVKFFISKSFHTKIVDFLPGIIALLVVSVVFYMWADFWLLRWGLGFFLGVTELIRIYKRKSIF